MKRSIIFLCSLMSLCVGYTIIGSDSKDNTNSSHAMIQKSLSMKEEFQREFVKKVVPLCLKVPVGMCFVFAFSCALRPTYVYKVHNTTDNSMYVHYQPGCKKAMPDSKDNNTNIVDVNCQVEIQPHQIIYIDAIKNKLNKICVTDNPHVLDTDVLKCASKDALHSNYEWSVHKDLSLSQYDEFVQNATTYQPNNKNTWSTFNLLESESK